MGEQEAGPDSEVIEELRKRLQKTKLSAFSIIYDTARSGYRLVEIQFDGGKVKRVDIARNPSMLDTALANFARCSGKFFRELRCEV